MSWVPGLWQRIVLGLASALLFLGAVSEIGGGSGEDALLPFLWGVMMLAVAVSPRVRKVEE